jgi:hypothetical protein
MKEAGLNMASHFKWGYGTNPSQGVIEGAEFFKTAYGFPLPNDVKPVCNDITKDSSQQKGVVEVVDLRGTYISLQGVLFPLPKELAQYQAPSIGGNAPAPKFGK